MSYKQKTLKIIGLAVLWGIRFASLANAGTFTQGDWSGGIAPNAASSSPTTYSAKETDIVAGTTLQLKPIDSSATQTSDSDFNAGTKANTVVTAGSVILQKDSSKIVGTITDLSSILSGSGHKYTSVAAVDANNIFISFTTDYTWPTIYGSLHVAKSTNGGSTWSNLTVDSLNTISAYNSITAVDANNIFISYYDGTSLDLKFAKSTNGGINWTLSTVDSVGDVGQYNSIDAFDANNIFISYRDVTTSNLKFAKSTNGGTSWTITAVGAEGGNGGVSIDAFDANNIFIGYSYAPYEDLKFAKSSNGGISWTLSTVDGDSSGRISTTGISLAVVDANNMFISYPDINVQDLRFAKSTNGGTSWTLSTVDSAGDVGANSSIDAVDANNIFITYLDNTNTDLKAAKSTNGGTNWILEILDSNGNTTSGIPPSIDAVDANNIFVSIKYSWVGFEFIKVVSPYFPSGTFESSTIDIGLNQTVKTINWDVNMPSQAQGIVGNAIPATTNGLVGLWRMENNWNDTTGGTNITADNGTRYGAGTAFSTSSKVGSYAGQFNGSDDYVSISNSFIDLGTSNKPYTVEAWVNPGIGETYGNIVHMSSGVGGGGWCYPPLTLSGGRFRVNSYAGGLSSAIGTTIAISGTWYHVATTWDPTNGLKLYVNGIPEATIPQSTYNASGTGHYIHFGFAVGECSGNEGWFNGRIDEAAIYKLALSSAEIYRHYMGNALKFQVAGSSCSNGASDAGTCITNVGWGDADTLYKGPEGTAGTYFGAGPVGLWHFNEGGTSSTTADASGNGNTGTLASINLASNAGNSTGSGWVNDSQAKATLGNTALKFDGTNDRILIADNASLRSATFTVEGWFKPDVLRTQYIVLRTSGNYWRVFMEANGIIEFDMMPGEIGNLVSTTPAVAGQWMHFTAVYNNALQTAYLYINGKLEKTVTGIASMGGDTVSPIYIGAWSTAALPFDGIIDEVAIYNRALSQPEIIARYNNGLGREGSVEEIGTAVSTGAQYLRYKAYLATADTLYTPTLKEAGVSYSGFPASATLTSSVFDMGALNNTFIKNITWEETAADPQDVRFQIGTSSDNSIWNYCGATSCAASWPAWGTDNYYTDKTVSVVNSESKDAVNDRYLKYRVALYSDNNTPIVNPSINITYDTAYLKVFAPDGVSANYAATAGTLFNAVVKVTNSLGDVISNHDGSRGIKLTASSAQPNKGTCVSSFNADGNTTYTSSVSFSGGLAAIPIKLCDATVAGGFTISAQETANGALTSNADLTITAVNPALANKLVFTTNPPAATTAGISFSSVIEIQDTYGNLCTVGGDAALTVVLSAEGIGLTGTLANSSLAASGGIASFSTLSYSPFGTFRLRASSGGLTTALSSQIVVSGNLGVDADIIPVGGSGGSPQTVIAGAGASGDGTTGVLTIKLTPANPIPVNGKIRITFPTSPAFNMSEVIAASSTSITDGGFSTEVNPSNVLTITRNGTQTGGITSTIPDLQVFRVKNPPVSGSTGVYKIETLTAGGVVIDQKVNITADTINPGVLSDTGVTSASYSSGDSTQNYTISFKTANPLSSGDYIKVQFDAEYTLTGAGIVSSSTPMTISNTSNPLILILNSGSSVTAGGTVSLIISGIKNPSSQQITDTYTIETWESTNTNKRDAGTAAGHSISAGALTVNTISTQTGGGKAGALDTYTFNFTTVNNVSSGGFVKVTFDPEYDVSGAVCSSCAGFSIYSKVSNILTMNVTSTIGDAVTASFQVSGIKNPPVTQTASPFTVETKTAEPDSNTIDTATYNGLVIIPNDLILPVTVSSGTYAAGDNTQNYTIAFTTKNPIPAGGDVVVNFDADYLLTGAAYVSGNAGSSISSTANPLVLTLGTAVAANTPVSLVISGIKNPIVTQTTDPYTITTRSDSDANIDTGTALGNTIAPWVLSASPLPSVTSESYIAGDASKNYTITFKTKNPVVSGGKVSVLFDSDYDLTGAAYVSGNSGASIPSPVTNPLEIILGTAVDINTTVTLVVSGIKNPAVTQTTVPYTITTKHTNNMSIDTGTVLGNTITPAAFKTPSPDATLSTYLVSAYPVTATFNFKLANPIPGNGHIKITFPSGFDISTVTPGIGGALSAKLGTLNVISRDNSTKEIVIRRADASSVAAGTVIDDLSIPNIKNPPISGITGTYKIQTRDATNNNPIDQDNSVQGDTITAGTISGANVLLSNKSPLGTPTITVSADLTNAIPAGGYIKIGFPVANLFTLPSALDAVKANSVTLGLTNISAVVSGNEITIPIAAGYTDGSGGAAIFSDLEITGVTNPNLIGDPGTWAIKSTDNSGNIINQTVAAGDDTITAGAITLTSVTLLDSGSKKAGGSPKVRIGAAFTSAVPAGGYIQVWFPAGFTFSGAVYANSATIGLTNALCIISDGSKVNIPASDYNGAVFSDLVLSGGIINPPVTGDPGPAWTIYTTQNDKISVVNAATGIDGADTILSGDLPADITLPGANQAGGVGNLTVTMTTTNPIPPDGNIIITFPGGFGFNADSGTTAVGNISGINGTMSVSNISGQTVTLTRSGGTSSAAGLKSFDLSFVKNPQVSGSTGVYQIKTTTSNTAVTIDENSAVPADAITSSSLSAVVTLPDSNKAGSQGTVTVSNILTANPIPPDGKILITFPTITDGADLYKFVFNSGGITSASITGNMDGNLSIDNITGSTITLKRGGGGSATNPALGIALTLSNIANPTITGGTGQFTLKTTNLSGTIIDESSIIPGSTLVAGSMAAADMTLPSSNEVEQVGSVTIAFTPNNPVPPNGKVVVTFPGGFIFNSGGATAASDLTNISGSMAVSVSGQVVTLARISTSVTTAGSALSFKLTNIKNPSAIGGTGFYQIKTTTNSNITIDEKTDVQEDILKGIITVTAPLGSAKWAVNETFRNISWSAVGGINLYKIEYATEDTGYGTWITIVNNCSTAAGQACNGNSYNWALIPDLLAGRNPGPNAQVAPDPDINAAIRITDAQHSGPASAVKDTVTAPFSVKYYEIKWNVVDAGYSTPLSGLSVIDSFWTGNTASRSAANITDPAVWTTHYYPYGAYMTTWNKDGYVCKSTVGCSAVWTADADKSFTVGMKNQLMTVNYAMTINTTYNEVSDAITVTAWLAEDGVLVKDVTDITVDVYAPDNATPLNAINLAQGKTPDANGIFNNMTYDPSAEGDTPLSAGTTYTIKGTITYSSQSYNAVNTFTIPAVGSYSVKIAPSYSSVNDSITAKVWLERGGALVTSSPDSLNFAVDPIPGSGTIALNIGAFNALSSAYSVEWDPSAGISTTTLYTLTATIVYNERTYKGNATFARTDAPGIGEIGKEVGTVVADKLNTQRTQIGLDMDTKFNKQKTDISSTVSSEMSSQTSALKSHIDTKTQDMSKIAESVVAILEDTQTTLPELMKNSSSDNSTTSVSKLLNTETEVKSGTNITLRYQTQAGLVPLLNVYNTNNTPVLANARMNGISTYGTTAIYEYRLTIDPSWGTGYFTITSSNGKGNMDSMVISVVSTDIDSLKADIKKLDEKVSVMSTNTGMLATMNSMSKDLVSLLEQMSSMGDEITSLEAKMKKDGSGSEEGVLVSTDNTASVANAAMLKTMYETLVNISNTIKENKDESISAINDLYEISEESAGDIEYLREKALELKTILEMNQNMLDTVVNKPTVKTWFERE